MKTAHRPPLPFREIWHLGFGLLGLQLGAALQLSLRGGFDLDLLPVLWLAAPVTALLLEPLIGSTSDRTWSRFGRRGPYILSGAAVAGSALFFAADHLHSPWIATALLWFFYAGINGSLAPYRARVADRLLPEHQLAGFAGQCFFIALGAALAGFLPSLLNASGMAPGSLAAAQAVIFKVSAVLLVATAAWSACFSREIAPEDLEEFSTTRESGKPRFLPSVLGGCAVAGAMLGIARGALVAGDATVSHATVGAFLGLCTGFVLSCPAVSAAVREMPRIIRQLALVQILAWCGLLCMWIFLPGAMAHQFFKDQGTAQLTLSASYAGETLRWVPIAGMVAAAGLPLLAQFTTRRMVHSCALLGGGATFLAAGYMGTPRLWLLTALGAGVVWISTLLVPFAIVAERAPRTRAGVLLGVFGAALALAEVAMFCVVAPVLRNTFSTDPTNAVMLGGALLIAAAVAMQFVGDHPEVTPIGHTVADEEGLLATTEPPEAPAT